MITLYQLHWSHFVEKTRWALDFKGVEWQGVEVDPFTKRELRELGCRTTVDTGRKEYTVPVIHDEATGTTLCESTSIVEYLEQTYPTPTLFAGDRGEIKRWMLWLDSTVGLAARRLAYTQISVEYPSLLAGLFLPKLPAESVKAKVAGAIIAGVLTRRFRFRHNQTDRVFEQLGECLLTAAARLDAHPYLVGDQFTAADLTLAALMRPVMLVPYFREHPRLQHLFEWRAARLQEHHRTDLIGYESALHEVRQRRGWALGSVRWLSSTEIGPTDVAPTKVPVLAAARNDQQSMGRIPMLAAPFEYFLLKQTCGLGRTAYSKQVTSL